VTKAEYIRSIDPFWRRAILATLAVLVAVAGACGTVSCSEGRLDTAANVTPDAAADVNPDAAANMTPDAAGDACEASSPPCPFIFNGVQACTWAQAEQEFCEFRWDAGLGVYCSESSCAGGINSLTCMVTDQIWTYYYDPSGAFLATAQSSNGTPFYSGPCTFNPDTVVCTFNLDAGCAGGALDSGSPESSAD
jgi:hypothetical protein